ncbi:5-oxoprolinase subunit PxpB [Alkalibacillus aidingensis]|uniref:5-oxoprolinase subunit PxpB n=1 Tax=Alkalibacillus aidingensis TaxID=2747607 RepID=UPI0016616D9E|nr:5-oxoprolinase subunit PxpB [Alkalibacillus aidingensis]
MNGPTIYPVGDQVAVVQFGEDISKDTHEQVMLFEKLIRNSSIKGLVDIIPTYHSVAVYYNWRVLQFDHVRALLEEMLAETENSKTSMSKRTVTIPVCYDEQYGPDLDHLQQYHQISKKDIIRLHTEQIYLVYMIGFLPGFPYLGGLNKRLDTPRLETPRATVPSGSVGIAGNQTGIYPLESPGGWNLIGRTPVSLFDPEQDEPTLLKMGDLLRFQSISGEEYREIEQGQLGNQVIQIEWEDE